MSRHRTAVWVLRLGAVAALLGAWLWANGPGDVSRLLLPTLPDVVSLFAELVTTSALHSALLLTLVEIGAALLLATAVGALTGFWAARTEFRSRVVEPMLAWGHMAPLVLFYPVFILWFGLGPSSKIGYAAVSAFFPIAYSALRAFRNVDERYLRVARAFGATALQTDWLVKWRAALPMVVSGVRIGAATSMITVILGEMLASEAGLGYLLARSSQTFAVGRSFAVILTILIVVGAFQLMINKALAVDSRRRRR